MTGPLDHRFTAIIGEGVPEGWSCVAMPGSAEFFGTGRSVRVRATVDGVEMSGGMMPTGTGDHMLSLNAAMRKKTGKGLGDEVTVHLLERLS